MKNNERNLVKIIKEICEEESIKLTSYSSDWIFRLSKDEITKHILGYRFELNCASIDAICNDKCATSDILKDNDIPCIEHHFFMSSSNSHYLNKNGNWEEMLSLLRKYQVIVCKPNEGTGGYNVIKVTNELELEQATSKIFSSSRALAICPYYQIKNEYRIIVLNNQVELIYQKQIPRVIGNGKDNVLQLLTNKVGMSNLIEFDKNINYSYVPAHDEEYILNWKHNLGLGAKAKIIEDNKTIEILSNLALNAAQLLNITFASIDIAYINDTYKVLEINSGVMMDYFSSMSEEYYHITKDIYKSAINLMFQKKE